MYKQIKNKNEGFTIIEVMIVLAIAALILIIVLLAVPALQRNSKNTTLRTMHLQLPVQLVTMSQITMVVSQPVVAKLAQVQQYKLLVEPLQLLQLPQTLK